MTDLDDPTRSPFTFAELCPEDYAAALAILIIVASVTWGVITRYVTETPAAWTTELAAIAFSWAVFLGSASAFRRAEHITFDLQASSWPPLARLAIESLGEIAVSATLIVIAWLSIHFTIATWETPTTVLRLPQGLLYAGAAAGFSLMVVRHAAAVVRKARSDWRAAA